jgi:hypothetical protein
MLPGGHARFEKRYETTHSGVHIPLITASSVPTQEEESTLATDRGFKERVREDMLVRLLDAFVWKNHGTVCDNSRI